MYNKFLNYIFLCILFQSCREVANTESLNNRTGPKNLNEAIQATRSDSDSKAEEGVVLNMFPNETTIWDELEIPVCWVNYTEILESDIKYVKEAISNSWEKHSDVKFVGWEKCKKRGLEKAVRIFAEDSQPRATSLGKAMLNGMLRYDGASLFLNFNFEKWGNRTCKNKRLYCLKVTAVHEFGHLLGFAHEHERNDTPKDCKKYVSEKGTPMYSGDTNVGDWDRDSVLNYCNPIWSNNGDLSDKDIEALQKYYSKEVRDEIKRKSATFSANFSIIKDSQTIELPASFSKGDSLTINLSINPNESNFENVAAYLVISNAKGRFISLERSLIPPFSVNIGTENNFKPLVTSWTPAVGSFNKKIDLEESEFFSEGETYVLMLVLIPGDIPTPYRMNTDNWLFYSKSIPFSIK